MVLQNGRSDILHSTVMKRVVCALRMSPQAGLHIPLQAVLLAFLMVLLLGVRRTGCARERADPSNSQVLPNS